MKKTYSSLGILGILVGAVLLAAAGPGRAQEEPDPALAAVVRLTSQALQVLTNETPRPMPGEPQPMPGESQQRPASTPLTRPSRNDRPTSVTAAITAAAASAPTSMTLPAPQDVAPLAEGEKLRFNFRGVSLDTVLDYMSKAAGFVIFRRNNANLNGRVDVVSHQPLNRDEAVALLNTVLSDKGYTAVRKERILTILSKTDAPRFSKLPVVVGSDPKAIPDNDVMVTQIMPVRYADATQLINDLLPLMETYTIASANQSSNAILLTDTQANIRRMAEIIQSLDTSISRISVLKVFVLKFADATETAKLINDLYRNMGTNSGASRDPRAQFMMMMGGGRGGRGGGDAGGGGATSEARKAATSLTAVADTRMNAVVVSGPDEMLPTIEQLLSEIDQSAQELKEIQVFTLKHADATEMTQVVNDVFQGKTTSSQSQSGRGGRAQFMQRFMGGGPGQSQSGTGEGRKAEENTVLAVADIRTNSVVVSASHDMMQQIGGMVQSLDTNPAKEQKVTIIPVKNGAGDQMQTTLQEMFGDTSTRSSSRSTSTGGTRTTTGRTTGSSSTSRGSTSRGSSSGSSGSGFSLN